MKKIKLSPSIMCGDLVNLETSIKELEANEFKKLHIDIIDGKFSPSMPLGIDTVKRMREITQMDFDVHIMSTDNEFFIQEMINIGVENITFHAETSLHIDRMIQLIKDANVKASIALNPATPIGILDHVIEKVDMVTLMLINPGFATNKNEKMVTYAFDKIQKIKSFIKNKNSNIDIQVDGRVSLETIADLVNAGSTNLVLGSTSLFRKGNTIDTNKNKILTEISKGLENKSEVY